MTSLGRQARELVEAARIVGAPTADDRARVRRRLTAALAAGAVVTAASTVPSSASIGTKIAASLAGKISIGTTVLAVVFGAGFYAGRTTSAIASTPARASAIAALSSSVFEASTRTPSPARDVSTTEEIVSTSAAIAAPPPTSVAVVSGAGRIDRSEHAASATVETPDTSIAAELALLAEAQRALRDGSPARALERLDALASRFPDGALGEEALAARVLADCALGRVDAARAEAEAFLERHPRSLLEERLRSSCALSRRARTPEAGGGGDTDRARSGN